MKGKSKGLVCACMLGTNTSIPKYTISIVCVHTHTTQYIVCMHTCRHIIACVCMYMYIHILLIYYI